MKNYIGAKIIKGEPMDERTFFETFKGPGQFNRETRPGYHVVYPPDGYDSWSPEKVFENAYREITDGEMALISPEPEAETSV